MTDLPGHDPRYAVISFGAYRAAVELDDIDGGTLWVHPITIPEGRSRVDALDYLRMVIDSSGEKLVPKAYQIKSLKAEWIRAIRRRDVELKLTESTAHEDEILAALAEVL